MIFVISFSSYSHVISIIDIIKQYLGKDIKIHGQIGTEKDKVNLKITSKTAIGKPLVEIRSVEPDYPRFYEVTIFEPLSLNKELYKQTGFFTKFFSLLGKSAEIVTDRELSTAKEILCFKMVKTKTFDELLFLPNLESSIKCYDDSKQVFEIELKPLNFAIEFRKNPATIIFVKLEIKDNTTYSEVCFLNNTWVSDWLLYTMKDISEKEKRKPKFNIELYYSFEIARFMIEILDPSAPEYKIFQEIFQEYEPEIEYLKKEGLLKKYYSELESMINYLDDTFQIEFDLLESANRSDIANELLTHILSTDKEYEIRHDFFIRHPIYPTIRFIIGHSGRPPARVSFLATGLRQSYKDMDQPLNMIISFYKKHLRATDKPFFVATPPPGPVIFIEVKYHLYIEFFSATIFHLKKFVYNTEKVVFQKIGTHEDGFEYDITYFIQYHQLVFKFNFYLDTVVEKSAGLPATYIYNNVKKIINNLIDKEIIDPRTNKRIEFFLKKE